MKKYYIVLPLTKNTVKLMTYNKVAKDINIQGQTGSLRLNG